MRFKVEYCQILMISLVIGTGRFIHGQNENDATHLLNTGEINTMAPSTVGATGRSEPNLNENYTDGSLTLAEKTKSSEYGYVKGELTENLLSTSGNSKSDVTELVDQIEADAKTELSTTENVANLGSDVTSSNPNEGHGNPAMDKRSPNFPSSMDNCNHEDYDPKFVITNLSPNNVSFEWRHSKCTKDQENVSYYYIVIIGLNKENYTFSEAWKDNKQATISSGSYVSLERKMLTFIPCASYKAILKVVWQKFRTYEYIQEFITPLNADNPLETYRKIQEETGPGWISLTWDMSRACAYNLSSIQLEISGGRDKPTPRVFKLPWQSCATWDSSETKVSLNLTNSQQNCLQDWRWEPCTKYNLSLTPILHNRQLDESAAARTTVLSIRTSLAEDYDPKFVITHLSPNNVSFEWRHYKCTKDQEKVLYYEVVIIGLNKENYTFSENWKDNKDNKQATISSGSTSTLNKYPFTFIPCASYKAILKVVWHTFRRYEYIQEFITPLNADNPLETYRKIQEETGPGWISLTWDMSRACAYNLSSIQLEISGGRDKPTPRVFELPWQSCATWDSSETKVSLNLTNSQQNCLQDWRWEPCTNYNLSLTPILHNRQLDESAAARTTVLSIRTSLENPEKDAQVNDLQIVEKGSNWLLLRWKEPYCVSETEKAYTILIQNSDGKKKWSACSETVSWDTVFSNSPEGGKNYHDHNLTRCNNESLTSCKTYNIRVRNDYKDPDNLTTTTNKRCDASGTTLTPSIEQFQIESPSLNELKLSWRISDCPRYPLLNYSLAVKADTKPATSFSRNIDRECLEFSIGQEDTDCGAQLTILPCTNYEFRLTPLFEGSPDKENGTQISYFTKFPAQGQYYAMTNGEVGSQWAVLNFILHPQCLRYVESLRLTLTDEDNSRSPRTYLAAPNCFPQSTMDGELLLNLTNSRCFPNFPGFQSCNGHYRLIALPTLIQELASRGFLQPSQIETRIELLRGDATSITNAKVEARGSFWIYLAWTPPACDEFLDKRQAYSLSLYEQGEANNPCNVTSTGIISPMNVSSVWCSNRKPMVIKPCTEYYFQVKAHFNHADMTRKASWTRSNAERTLPDPRQSYVQNLGVSNVSSTRTLLSWEPPMCNHFLQDYGLQLSDSNAGGKEVLFVVVPLSCSTGSKLYWPNEKCIGLITTPNKLYWPNNNVELEPCTDYIAKVWPQQTNGKGSVTEINFTTKPAKPGKIGFLHLAHTNTTLTVKWGNITHSARCLQGYELVLAEELGGSVSEVRSVHKDLSYYNFDKLKPCTSYEITVRSWGEIGSEEVAKRCLTDESPPGPPRNLTCPSTEATGVSLTWSPPENYVECVHFYHVEIFQVEPNGTKTHYRSQTCSDTKIYCTGLESSTQYEFRITARTQNHYYSSPEALIKLTTAQAEGNLTSVALAFVIILVLLCIAFIIVLTYWCYVKQPWNLWLTSCYDKERVFIRHRSSSYSRADGGGIGQPGSRSSRSSRRHSRHSLHNYATNRPIPLQHFDRILQELSADTCALLGEEYEDVKLLSNENQPKTSAAVAENKIKNRYLNILPYDHTRVQLQSVDGDEHGDYINASFIQGFNGPKEYIAAQGPKPVTVPDFWRMIWEQDVRVLVMVTQVEEHGKIKCAQYWPDSKQNLSYGNIRVSQVLQVAMDDYVIRDLEVDCDGSKRVVKQMHFLTWPDFGCPQNPETLLSFIEAVRDRVSSLSEAGPILVHCSAGVGRTGTFIAVDWLTQEARVSSQVDVFNTVLKLRSDRMNMVQTEDQYLFIHHCLSHFLKTRLGGADSPAASSDELQPDCEQPKMSKAYNPSPRTLHSSQANLAESAM